MSEAEHAKAVAGVEYKRNGVLSLPTVMKLNSLGVDVPAFERQLEKEQA